ncbi:hypothetical protein RUND412_005326 [Rhizina undulata]
MTSFTNPIPYQNAPKIHVAPHHEGMMKNVDVSMSDIDQPNGLYQPPLYSQTTDSPEINPAYINRHYKEWREKPRISITRQRRTTEVSFQDNILDGPRKRKISDPETPASFLRKPTIKAGFEREIGHPITWDKNVGWVLSKAQH